MHIYVLNIKKNITFINNKIFLKIQLKFDMIKLNNKE